MTHFKTTWHHIRRSPYQAFAAILIMVLTFLTISVFSFLIVGSSKIIHYFESKPQVTAFFKDETKPENITLIKEQLMRTQKISDIQYISKQQALKIYKEQNKNDPLLLDLVTADILPASLEISTKNIGDLSEIATFLKGSPWVQEVVFQQDVVSGLTSWTNALRQIGIGLIIVLSVVSIFIMMTIVSIKISQKREEIEVMRLLGATKWYISMPFLFEGIIYGMIGAFIGWFIATGVLLYATPFLNSFLRGIFHFPLAWIFFVELLGLEFGIAILLGVISSGIAVIRYLK